ncbi:Hypothetical protein CINCED_3A024801 [Cinara cedri]|uniref:Uncharacterized protein n=1 Tax=Cinara cedri TaxID=506608 RepID=A0A5E4NLD0_9HEMI|nr:Hypothetical protein CINCED_3A024801 [Cinara cedri]
MPVDKSTRVVDELMVMGDLMVCTLGCLEAGTEKKRTDFIRDKGEDDENFNEHHLPRKRNVIVRFSLTREMQMIMQSGNLKNRLSAELESDGP